jgi:hypothetical protein
MFPLPRDHIVLLRHAEVWIVLLSDSLHLNCEGVLFAVLITAVFTDVMKTAVGRPRPDFFWRCFPDGKQV